MREMLVILAVTMALPAPAALGRETTGYERTRARFQTNLTRRGPAPGSQEWPIAPSGVETVRYPSGELRLGAWLAVPDQRPRPPRSPAVVFFHGGFALDESALEMARPFLAAGYLVMLPMLRGENGNPGHFELLLGEIDDAAAAVRWVAARSDVDPARIYTYGHSMGGRVSLMLSLRGDAPIRMGGSSAALYTAEGFRRQGDRAPFDVTLEAERRVRAPRDYLADMPRPHLAFAGRQEYSPDLLAEWRRAATGTRLEIREVDGDHMSCLQPALAEFLRAIGGTDARSPRFRAGCAIGSAWSMHAALGDLDDDGDLDLVQVNYGGPSRVWMNDGTAAFSDSDRPLGRSAAHAAALGDLDGDGDLDLFIANVEDQPNSVWINDGKGRFTRSGQEFEPGNSLCVALGDLDRDGDLDGVVGRMGAGALVVMNDGKGRFTPSGPPLGGDAMVAGCALGDLDADGDLDLVTGGSANLVWKNDGSGRFVQAQVLDEPGRRVHAGLALADLDGDGRIDLVLGFGGGDRHAAVWLNEGAGRLRRAWEAAGPATVNGLSVTDLDRDGDFDIVFAQKGGNTVWINDGHARFADAGLQLGEALSYDVAADDIDGDGAPDLVFADSDPAAADRAVPSAVWLQEQGEP